MGIDRRAVLDSSRGTIEIAEDVEIAPYAVLVGPLTIGAGTRIAAHAVVGAPPKKRGAPAQGRLHLGARVAIGEGAVIDAPTSDRGSIVGDDTMILPLVYLGHDARIDRAVTIASHVSIGGRVVVHAGATIGLGATLHQSTTVGAHALIGMRAVVTGDVPPLAVAYGAPARLRGVNVRGAERSGLDRVALARAEGILSMLTAGVGPDLDEGTPVDALFLRFLAEARRPLVKGRLPLDVLAPARASSRR